ncbi:restriction endonuclease subunit S [Kocuria soli]|uniref:Restriction endonuclease subunit S n=1 Tax=Kocuria soli TaxID=2485125 RepID=A0A3N3ZRJ1_9MICC|nr:restriction endonuclease subunit S [Kocuria soli]ROZ63937.1 restriction endonuclease subunit S [Kocuria soli]
MSRIDELIQDLCPDGVEFKPLGELLDYEQPAKYLVSSARYDDSHKTPVLTAGQKFILGYTDETEGIYSASSVDPVVIFDDFTTAFKWVEFRFKVKSSAMKMLSCRLGAGVSLRFVWYAMQTIAYRPQDHARQWIGTYSKFRIPVPPLDVQREIVRILDQFTQLEAELEAELEARRRQYDHYRHEAFSFSPDAGIRWSTLGAISSHVSSGGTPSSGRDDYYGGGIPWVRTQEVDFGYITSTGRSITDAGLANSSAKWIPANCVIVAMYGATAAKVAINSIPVTTNQACCNLDIDPNQADFRFVFHWISREYGRLKSLGEGSQSNLNSKKVKEYRVPVPSLEDQRRIVALLDNFDTLVNDLSIGIPAELAARRRQYEHYRDRLLTFKELAA